MIYFTVYVSMLVGAFCTVIAVTAMRQREKHNIGRFGWLMLVLLTPPIGLLLFLFFGGKKISAEHEKRDTVDLPESDDAIRDIKSSVAEIVSGRGLPWPSSENRLRILTTPESMYRGVFEIVQSAQRRILVHSFILNDDPVGNSLVDCLCEKAGKGVEVFLMVDGFGSFMFPQKLLSRVESAGGNVTRFKPVSKLSRFAYSNFRNHRKMAIADGCRMVIGGANFAAEEMTLEPGPDT
jgi:cardiolipin synthase